MLRGQYGHVVCPENVVFDRLEDVCFHQGDVLVGGGMIDHRWRVLAQDLVQAGAILYAPDLRVEGRFREGLAHFAVDFEQGGLGDFESNNSGGVEACNLPAEFGADGPGRAGDQYDFASEHAADLVLFQLHGVAAEQILNRHLADLSREAVPFDDFGETGDGLIENTGILTMFEDGGHLPARGGGQGDENHFDCLRCNDRGQRGPVAEHFHPMNEVAGLRRIVVDEANYLVAQRGIPVDLPEQSDSCVTGSVDKSAFPDAQIRQP